MVNMSILTTNKRCRKLKDWCFKMPNFSYCHRCVRISGQNIHVKNQTTYKIEQYYENVNYQFNNPGNNVEWM